MVEDQYGAVLFGNPLQFGHHFLRIRDYTDDEPRHCMIETIVCEGDILGVHLHEVNMVEVMLRLLFLGFVEHLSGYVDPYHLALIGVEGKGNPGSDAYLYDSVTLFYIGFAKAYSDPWKKKMRKDRIVNRRILPVYLFYVVAVHCASKIREICGLGFFHKVADGLPPVKKKWERDDRRHRTENSPGFLYNVRYLPANSGR